MNGEKQAKRIGSSGSKRNTKTKTNPKNNPPGCELVIFMAWGSWLRLSLIVRHIVSFANTAGGFMLSCVFLRNLSP